MSSPSVLLDPGLALGVRRPPGWRPWLRPALGFVLVLLGIILWLLPVVPGFVLALVGAPMVLSLWPRREARFKRRMVRVATRIGLDHERFDRGAKRRRRDERRADARAREEPPRASNADHSGASA